MSHPNARLTLRGRLLLCERIELQGWRVHEAAAAAGISRQTASKWLARWRVEGRDGLRGPLLASTAHRPARDRRRPAPRRQPACRPAHGAGDDRLAHAHLAPATVYRTLRRLRLHRLRFLDPREPVVRYCWPHAGDLVHLDTKKLGRIGAGGGKRFGGPKDRYRGIGWDVAHVAVDDATRLAYAEELADERGETAAAFLERALAFFESHGVRVQRLLTDNGSPYLSQAFARRQPEPRFAPSGARGPTGRRPTARRRHS